MDYLKRNTKEKDTFEVDLAICGHWCVEKLSLKEDVYYVRRESQQARYIWLLGLFIKPSIPTDFVRAKGTCWGQRKGSGMRK